jgi:hypothetical protein
VIEIALTASEEKQCVQWAMAINAHKAALGKRGSRRYEGGDPDANRIAAIRSEYAVAKALKLPYSVEIYDGGDGGVDLWFPASTAVGRSIQIKWRGEPGRDLATDSLNFHKDLRADIYVLCWPGRDNQIALVGWCTRKDFLRRILARPPDRLLGLKWAMRPADLRPIELLIELLAEPEKASFLFHDGAVL